MDHSDDMRCEHCQQPLDPTRYLRWKSINDHPLCKACQQAKVAKARAEKREHYLEYGRAYNRNYYADPELREAQYARRRAWHQAHKDEQQEYARRYHAEHREERLDSMRRYYAEHREEHREEHRDRVRRYRAEHREESRERQREYGRRNRAKQRAQAQQERGDEP